MFVPFNEKEIAIPTPWTSYRKLLVEFKNYLGVTGREKEFKLYFRGSIPTKNWSVDIVEYLRILEEADVVNMYRLEILDYFLKTASDSNNIRSTIREFQYRLHLVQTLLNHAEVHSKLKLRFN